jgi:hypothetical protein
MDSRRGRGRFINNQIQKRPYWNLEKLERMRKVVDLNLGYGKYYCLRRLVALLELHKAVFEARNE